MTRRTRSVFVALAAALVSPGAAFAHATLKSESPRFQQRFERAPARVVLRFDQGVKALPSSVQVYTTRGKLVSGAARNGSDARVVEAPLHPLRRGAYTVRWHAISSDGHVVSGVYTFGVREAAPPPTQAYGASGPTTSEHVVRWLYFAALALLVGGLGFRLLILPRQIPPRLEKRLYVTTAIGAFSVIQVGIAAFVLRAEDALQLPFGKLLYGDLSPIAQGTRFGKAFIVMTLGFAWVGALLFLAWLSDRRGFLWTAFALGLLLASGLSLSGHSAADRGSSWLSQLADWVHLSAAILWVGGLLQLALCVWPLAPELRRTVFLRFARLAPVLIALLVAAGVYLSILRLPQLDDLWTAGYGRVLLVKLGLVSTALAWGGFHHFVVRPRLASLTAAATGRRSRPPRRLAPLAAFLPSGRVTHTVLSAYRHPAARQETEGAQPAPARWVRQSLVGEGAVAMAILLLAAILVDSKPPAAPQQATRTSLESSVSSSPSNPP